MADTYNGAWRNRALGYTDEVQPLGASDPERHMTDFNSGAHGLDDTARTRRAINVGYALDLPPAELEDATDTYVPAAQSAGVPIDQEPRDHANGDTEWSLNNTLRDQVQPSPLHSRDRGSMWARRIRQPRSYQWDEKLSTPRVAANPTIDGSERARTLGTQFAGARPENNPAHVIQRTRGDVKATGAPPVGWTNEDGPRIGWRIFRWDERKFPMHRVRHDSRWLPLHVAKTAQDAPEPIQGSQYTSPYPTLASARMRNALTPMLRRQPNAWDDNAVQDGSSDIGEALTSWGL